VLDRDRRPVGGQLEQLRLLVAEHTRRQRTDVEHPDRLAARHQRHAEERLDPLLAQDRVEDVGMVDVGQEDRLPQRRDPPREALAERDPDALLHLLLDPDRGARDQLVGGPVEQQDRAGVDGEDVVRSLEQRRQELVQLQVRQRRVREELQAAKPICIVREIGHGWAFTISTPFRCPASSTRRSRAR
jgi:hypothetical protein